MPHFTQNDLAEIEKLANEKVQQVRAGDDFEMYVLLRAIPKLIDDTRGVTRLEMFDASFADVSDVPQVYLTGTP